MPLLPSNFPGDDYGEATNQIGHMLVGAAVVSAGYALGLGPVAVAIGVLLGVLWEAWHLMIGGRGKDSRNDLFFYAFGLAYAGPLWWPILGLALVAAHVWWRGR
jgi:hypothetical protein